MDPDRLARAAAAVARGSAYPWSVRALCGDSNDDAFIPRLVRHGWLASRDGRSYQVPHDRLLNWAAAQGLVNEVRHYQLSGRDLGKLLLELHRKDQSRESLLRYVTMDVLWLLSQPGDSALSVVEDVLTQLEESDS